MRDSKRETGFAVAELKVVRDRLYAETASTDEALKAFPKGPMGLTPDDVKVSHEYRAAKAKYDKAFATLRAFNVRYAKYLH